MFTLIAATAIHTWKYLILSNFRSKAGAGMVSTAIGDGVGIPCAVAYLLPPYALYVHHILVSYQELGSQSLKIKIEDFFKS